MKIAVVGSGYVGLVAGACIADMGHHVTCIDCDADKVQALRAGVVPIYEPGLDDLIARAVRAGFLTFDTNLEAAVSDAKLILIAVSTGDSANDGKPDLSSVFSTAEQVAALLRTYCVVVVKSTVPVGTGDLIERILGARCSRDLFDVVSNPEFLREGRAIPDFKKPDRIVIGANTARARARMAQVYSSEHFDGAPILVTTRRSAELMKYACNAFLASKVAFINEIAEFCERVGADVDEISRGMGLDKRIGNEFLQAGPGFGGSCLPKDTRALVRMAKEHGSPLRLFEATVLENEARKRGLVQRVIAACGGSIAGCEVALMGLTFKSDTDDMRESPSLPLILGLQAHGAKVRAYDPKGMQNAARVLSGVRFVDSAYDCAQGAHAAVVMTDWEEFRQLDLHRLRSIMADPVIIDMRNIYDPSTMALCDFTYISVGRLAISADNEGRLGASKRMPEAPTSFSEPRRIEAAE